MNRQRLGQWLAITGIAVLGALTGRAQPHVGFFYDELRLTLEPGSRVEAAGPFFYDEVGESHTTLAVPPLFSLTEDPSVELKEYDFLAPLVTYRRYGQESRLQFLQMLSFAGGAQQDGSLQRRFTLFPFYFQQRGPGTNDDYTAVWPFYGTMRNRLFRDEISFVMWPLYVQTQRKGVTTDNYVYPFVSLRKGEQLSGWKVWPLMGREHKDSLTRTNRYGDLETVAGHDRFMLLWPIHYNNHTGLGTTNPVHSVGVLPLFAFDRSPSRDSTSVLWPFFNVIDDRGRRYREWQLPWPIVDFARGEGKTTSRVWPFYSTSQTTNQQSDFYLWPLYKFNRLQLEQNERERTRILLFLYSDTVEQNKPAKIQKQRTDLWPLFTARRDANGNERFQLFAPVEPILPNRGTIERNWSPLWSVYRAESNATTRATSQSFLWNLYRKNAAPDSKNVSLLFGLFQYDTNPEATRWRLFHVPVATKRKSGTQPP